MDAGKGKDKMSSDSSDRNLQAFLGKTHFKPLSGPDGLKNKYFDRLFFGTQSLIVYPESNLTFRQKQGSVTDRTQKCLIDNLWIAYNKTPKDNPYFISVLNALTFHFTERNKEKNFNFYTVTRGKRTGVFRTWNQVVEVITDYPIPIFKGFNDFQEALEFARKNIGPNFYIVPELKNPTSQNIPYIIPENKNQINFCDHCETMSRAFKHLNTNNDIITHENQQLKRQNQILQDQIHILQETLK